MRDEIGGYWAAGFGGATAHWWKESPSDIRYVRSSCGLVEKVNNIGPEWGRPRCKRCVKSLIAMEEKDDEK